MKKSISNRMKDHGRAYGIAKDENIMILGENHLTDVEGDLKKYTLLRRL